MPALALPNRGHVNLLARDSTPTGIASRGRKYDCATKILVEIRNIGSKPNARPAAGGKYVAHFFYISPFSFILAWCEDFVDFVHLNYTEIGCNA